MKSERIINIEVRGVGFVNKGAELMLQAIKHKMAELDTRINLVMEVNYSAGLKKAKKLFNRVRLEGLSVKPAGRIYRVDVSGLYSLFPKALKKKRGIVLEKEIDVILDASGFAFGDQWGVEFAKRRLTKGIERWKKQGKKIILLPQAFGPFKDEGVRREVSKIIKFSDIIFARDTISYEHLLEQKSDAKKIVLRPDFTNLVTAEAPEGFTVNQKQVAIIPNFKMGQVEGGMEQYLNLLTRCISLIQKSGGTPFFLIHEGEKDEAIAIKINDQLSGKVPLVSGQSALAIKGIIGSVYAVITSRFHGLVSALSQGTPCLATSWSHKYRMLLDDYEYSDGLLDAFMDEKTLTDKLEMILHPEKHLILKEKLKKNAEIQKQLSGEMWREVFTIFDELKKTHAE